MFFPMSPMNSSGKCENSLVQQSYGVQPAVIENNSIKTATLLKLALSSGLITHEGKATILIPFLTALSF